MITIDGTNFEEYGKVFITSDLHFCHNRDFLYEPRGFSSIAEHDQAIIERWNKIVSPEDIVFILGDIMLCDNHIGKQNFLQLNGNKYIVTGNHDNDYRIALYFNCWNVKNINYAYRVRYNGFNFYLTHYPTLTGNFDIAKPLKARVINLCGHSHTSDPFADWELGPIFHTELDTNNNEPWLLDDIITKIKEKVYG